MQTWSRKPQAARAAGRGQPRMTLLQAQWRGRGGAEPSSRALLGVLVPGHRAAPHRPPKASYAALLGCVTVGSGLWVGTAFPPGFQCLVGGGGRWAHSLRPAERSSAPRQDCFGGTDNRPMRASGLTELPANLESNRLWQLHSNLNSLSCGFFRLMQICFALQIENQLQAPGVRIPAGSGEP